MLYRALLSVVNADYTLIIPALLKPTGLNENACGNG